MHQIRIRPIRRRASIGGCGCCCGVGRDWRLFHDGTHRTSHSPSSLSLSLFASKWEQTVLSSHPVPCVIRRTNEPCLCARPSCVRTSTQQALQRHPPANSCVQLFKISTPAPLLTQPPLLCECVLRCFVRLVFFFLLIFFPLRLQHS